MARFAALFCAVVAAATSAATAAVSSGSPGIHLILTPTIQALKSPSVNYLGQNSTYFGTAPTGCIPLSPPYVSSVSSVQIAKSVRCTCGSIETKCGLAAGKSITLNGNVPNLVNLEFNDLAVAFECLV
ncbi:hypothetical protein B0H13DRAFT_1995383 [Mycena leptocephala]|nr:hypothetical protein B0H13DRAFT_1995383 [Mycena leptocephala]